MPKIQGEIEVILEDRKGRIKARESHKNTITEAYLRHVFYNMLTVGMSDDSYYGSSGLAKVLQSALYSSDYSPNGNLLFRSAPTEYGIYAMNKTIDVQPDTFVPPYVSGNHTALDSSVTFYNVNGAASENSQVMVPSRCVYDNDNVQFIAEYIKNTGAGTVQSVCIGRNHSNRQLHFASKMKDSNPVDGWSLGAGDFMLEHGTDFTKVWKKAGTGYVYRCDFKNKTVETLSGSSLTSNLSSNPWLVVGNVIFRVQLSSASGSTHVVRLYYRNNFQTSTTEAYKDITFTKRTDATLRTDTYPVLVYRPDTNKLEIFVTLSIGNHADGGYGCNVWKASVDNLENPASMTSTLTDMGVIPYAVCTRNSTSNTDQYTGLFYDGKYYLSYGFFTENGNTYQMNDSTYNPGIIASPDLTVIHKLINYQNNQTYPNVPVICADGVHQFQLNLTDMPRVFLSQIVSGANLTTPITKTADDVLKIRYKYKLA